MINEIKIGEVKPIGIIRRMDTLGRIVIPIEYCKHMGVNKGDELEILYTDKGILLTKPKP